MKKNMWMKSLLAASIMAALSAGAVWAATPEEDAAIQQQGRTYNRKVEQGAEIKPEQEAVQTEDAHTRQSGNIKSKDGSPENDPSGRPNDGQARGERPDGMRGPRSGETRSERPDGMRGPRGGEMRGERPDGMRGPRGDENLTEEQRKQLAAEREKFFGNWNNMTEEQRHEATEKFIARIDEEKMKNMSEAEKKAFVKQQAERKAEREKVAKMTEDERHSYFQKKHDRMVKERTKDMSKEEKSRFLEREKHRQERMDASWKRWKSMTPAEKEQWKKDHPGRPFAPELQERGTERPDPAAEAK